MAQGCSSPSNFLQAGIALESLLPELAVISFFLAERLSTLSIPESQMVSLVPPEQSLQAIPSSSAEGHGRLKLSFLVPKNNTCYTLPCSGGRGKKRRNINEKQRSIGQLNHPKAKQMQKDDSFLFVCWPILFLRISITNLNAWRWQERLKLFHAELQLGWKKTYLFFLTRMGSR